MVSLQLDSSPTTVGAAHIYSLIETHLMDVKESLKQIVPPETELLAGSIAYSMQSRGKLLRPVLALLISGATGEIDDAHIETAAVAELIHVATLLHDDVLDESDIRRGKSTVRSRWGNKVSILSGDYLLAQASLKLSYLNNCRLVSIFSTVLSNLCEGEVEQIRHSFNLQTSWDSYFKKSMCKTATLFGACCESAAVLNGLSEEQIGAVKTFGEKVGLAFQIVDDQLDYTSSAQQLGKPVLDDLKNGILTAPALLALETFPPGSPEQRRLQALIEAWFEAPEEGETLNVLGQELLSLFDAAGAIAKTQSLAEDFARQAREAIAFLPDTPYREALTAFSQYATHRSS